MKYLLILFLFISCKPNHSNLEYFDAYIYNNWLEAHSVVAKYPEGFSANKSIVDPQMTWKIILKVSTKDFVDCLFYRIPHKRLNKGKGIIKVVRVSKKETCSRALEKRPEISIEGISHFKTYFTSKLEKNLISKREFKPFHLYMSATRDNEKDWALVLPLHNITANDFLNPNKIKRKQKKYKRYDQPWKESLRPGMSVYPNDFKPMREVVIDGNLKLNYAQNNIKFCYRVDKTCKVVQDFECQKCKRGWYSVVDYNCNGGGSKLCGPSECGGRNQPACPRGTAFEIVEDMNLCFRGSNAGICEKGLETYCDENQVLVCR